MDLAPTVLDLLGIDAVGEFKGCSVLSADPCKRVGVISEDLGPGVCDFSAKQARVCVSDGENKVILHPGVGSHREASAYREEFVAGHAAGSPSPEAMKHEAWHRIMCIEQNRPPKVC